jgi:PKD repeat protein
MPILRQPSIRLFFALILPFLCPGPASSGSIPNEVGEVTTLVHPADDCCWPDQPERGKFFGAHGVSIGSEYYFYITGGQFGPKQESGDGEGEEPPPGSECDLEDILIFSVSNDDQSLRGLGAAADYRGVANPCDGTHWHGGTVFRDLSLGGHYYMTATKATPDGGPDEFSDIFLGESPDGETWTWELLMTTSGGIKIPQGFFVLPDPANPGEWIGVFSFGRPGGQPVAHTGFIRLDFNSEEIIVKRADSGAEQPIPFGGDLSFEPRSAWGERAHSLIQTGGAYEVWAVQHPQRSGIPPCEGDLAAYYDNVGTDPTDEGSQPIYRRMNVSRLGRQRLDFSLGPVQTVTSSARSLPTDYKRGLGYPFRVDSPGGLQLLYTSSLDPTVCDLDIEFGTFRSMGIQVTTLGIDQDPVAQFQSSCQGLACTFDASLSTDDHPPIPSEGYSWSFGDSATGQGIVASHTYAESGSYEVELTVTDSAGNTDVASQWISVTDGSSGDIRVERAWDGEEVPNGGSFTFPSSEVGKAVGRVFIIRNVGTGALELLDPSNLVHGDCFFQIDQDPVSPISPGGEAEFRVRFRCGVPGTSSGTVSIANDAPGENPYQFSVFGTATPTARIFRNWDNIEIPYGGSFTFPPVAPSEPISRLFRIDNVGSQTLTLANPTSLVTGGCFSQIGDPPLSTLSPGQSTEFRIRFRCPTPGTRSGTVSIDFANVTIDPFVFSLQGTVQ